MKKGKNILVVTHPRSGTHFAINAICMNFKGAEFPLVRRGFASMGGLFSPHDERYTREWEKILWENNNEITLFKSHFTPSEISKAINTKFFFGDRDRKIVKEIYENSKILHVYRDGRDALVSMYYFYKNAGGSLPQGSKFRLAECGFSEFIKMPNDHYTKIRGFEERDENRPKYWSSYVDEWFNKEGVAHISYESLCNNFEESVRNLACSLDIEDLLSDEIKRPELHTAMEKADLGSKILKKTKKIFSVMNKKAEEPKIVYPSYPRKGIVGDWQSHFSGSDLEFFLKYAKDTMLKLNYKI